MGQERQKGLAVLSCQGQSYGRWQGHWPLCMQVRR